MLQLLFSYALKLYKRAYWKCNLSSRNCFSSVWIICGALYCVREGIFNRGSVNKISLEIYIFLTSHCSGN